MLLRLERLRVGGCANTATYALLYPKRSGYATFTPYIPRRDRRGFTARFDKPSVAGSSPACRNGKDVSECGYWSTGSPSPACWERGQGVRSILRLNPTRRPDTPSAPFHFAAKRWQCP